MQLFDVTGKIYDSAEAFVNKDYTLLTAYKDGAQLADFNEKYSELIL